MLGHQSGASLAFEPANLNHEVVRTLNMVGPLIMSAEEQNMIKQKLLHASNEPVVPGAYLLITWHVVRGMMYCGLYARIQGR